MKDNIVAYGGINVGSFNATWPLVKMTITKEQVLFNIMGLKKIRVHRKDILSVKTDTFFPYVATGVAFNTKETKKYGFWFFVPTNKIIFRNMGSASKMTKKINEFWN